jgi:acyl-CoA dehydrogenase
MMIGHGSAPGDAAGYVPEERSLLEELRQFARDRVAGHPGLFHPQDFPSDLFRAMGEMRLLGATDLGTIARGDTIIAATTGSLGFASAWAGQSLVPLVLDKRAGLPAEVKAGVPTGATIISLAISEPKAGAHPKHLATAAIKIPGGWKIEGEKAYVTNGPIASHIAVLAVTEAKGGRKAFSFFLIPTGTPGLKRMDHPQFDFLRPAQHCGFRLEGCTMPESALIGTPGKAFDEIALPFRNLEDAAGIGGLIAVLGHATRRLAARLPAPITDEIALALGEVAGLETAMQALDDQLIRMLEGWNTETDEAGIRLVAIRDLARRQASLLREIGTQGNEPVDRILRDVEKSLDIARGPRQIRKARLGRSVFVPGKHAE